LNGFTVLLFPKKTPLILLSEEGVVNEDGVKSAIRGKTGVKKVEERRNRKDREKTRRLWRQKEKSVKEAEKGKVSRDFRLVVFFMYQFPPSP
jgi:hypothetical protein